MVYSAVGPDGGGCLYAYNTSQKAKKLISKMQCSEISEKGNYLYCTVNKYGGSDGRNKYIYKIAKNGKSSKKLANGFCPIIIDNYISNIGCRLHIFGERYGWIRRVSVPIHQAIHILHQEITSIEKAAVQRKNMFIQ